MPLAAGTRFGPSETLASIGAGVIGKVYRARGRKLQRDVGQALMNTAKLLLTMSLTALISLTVSSVSVAMGAPNQAGSSTALAKVFDDYIEAWLPLNPIDATSLGDHRYDDRFPDTISEAYRSQLRAVYTRYLGAAQRVDTVPLSAKDKLSLAILLWELTIRLALMDNDDYLRPVHQMNAVPSEFALLGSAQHFRRVEHG